MKTNNRTFLKLVCLPVALLLLSSNLTAQSNEETRIGAYKWIRSIRMTPSDIEGKDLSLEKVLSRPGQTFLVVFDDETNEQVIIKIDNYTENQTLLLTYNFNSKEKEIKDLSPEQRSSRLYDSAQRYFSVSYSDLETHAVRKEKVKAELALGVINYPLKIRFQKGNADFTGAFNLGLAANYTFPASTDQMNRWSLLFGSSLTNVNLTGSSVSQNSETLEDRSDVTAYSFAGGVMVERNKAQIGLFYGFDFLGKQNKDFYGWRYQGKPWISIGFSYSLFSKELDKAKGESPNPTQEDE